MIRRALLVAAAAGALILVPSVAMAYNAPGYGTSVSDPTPAAGSQVTITVRGLPNETIKLVVTSSSGGVKTYTAKANASGVATFTITAGAAGTRMTMQAFNAAGQFVSDQTLKVPGRNNNNNGTGNGNGKGSGNGGALAISGFDGLPLAAGGGLLVLAGAGGVVVAKRRRSAHDAA